MANHELTSIRELLPKVLTQLAHETGGARHLRAMWNEAVGPVIAEKTAPMRLQNGVLFVQVANPTWGAELARRERELLARLPPEWRVARLSFCS